MITPLTEGLKRVQLGDRRSLPHNLEALLYRLAQRQAYTLPAALLEFGTGIAEYESRVTLPHFFPLTKSTLVPFKATISETYTLSVCGQYARCITVVGTGIASHLGTVTESSTVLVDINPANIVNGCSPEIRSTTLAAANGDMLTIRATGWTCFATNSAYDSYLVTGGTGRFEGAVGSGTDTNVHTLTGPGVGIAWVNFMGDLSY